MKLFSNRILVSILLISILFGICVQSGLYGFNIDYYREYYKPNLYYELIFDRLGALLSTLTIYNFSIGLFLTSFTLAMSSGLLLLKCFEFYLKRKNNFNKLNILIFFLTIYIMTLHIHPIIMSTSGAMRQGWSMSFLFFSIILILNKKFLLSFIFIFFSIFMHKSGMINIIYFVSMLFAVLIADKFKQKLTIIFLFCFIFTLIFAYLFYYLKENSFLIGSGLVHIAQRSRIVYGDFRFYWLFFNLSYIVLYFIYTNKSKMQNELKYPSTFLLFASFGNIIILFNDLNFQYERLNMMLGIIYLHVTALFFRSLYLYIVFLLTFFYLILTIKQGMYSIGLT